MKQSWENESIGPNQHKSCNRSKLEIEFFDKLVEVYPEFTRSSIKTKTSWAIPDCISLKDSFIVEFYGDYWHGNPSKFKPEDIVAHKTKAKDVWKKDSDRIANLEDLGYFVVIVWESDYKKDKEGTINKISNLINWDSCSF